jgi:hypothetical protein
VRHPVAALGCAVGHSEYRSITMERRPHEPRLHGIADPIQLRWPRYDCATLPIDGVDLGAVVESVERVLLATGKMDDDSRMCTRPLGH